MIFSFNYSSNNNGSFKNELYKVFLKFANKYTVKINSEIKTRTLSKYWSFHEDFNILYDSKTRGPTNNHVANNNFLMKSVNISVYYNDSYFENRDENNNIDFAPVEKIKFVKFDLGCFHESLMFNQYSEFSEIILSKGRAFLLRFSVNPKKKMFKSLFYLYNLRVYLEEKLFNFFLLNYPSILRDICILLEWNFLLKLVKFNKQANQDNLLKNMAYMIRIGDYLLSIGTSFCISLPDLFIYNKGLDKTMNDILSSKFMENINCYLKNISFYQRFKLYFTIFVPFRKNTNLEIIIHSHCTSKKDEIFRVLRFLFQGENQEKLLLVNTAPEVLRSLI